MELAVYWYTGAHSQAGATRSTEWKDKKTCIAGQNGTALVIVISTLSSILGIETSPVSHTERLVSALGSLLVIAAVFLVTRASLDTTATLLIVPSMGASAVLLFAVPHGALSQPWNVFAGHILSALVGVSCAMLIGNEIIAASMAVGIAVGVMHYTRSIHPPGGATALAAVIGGEATHALGYQFVFTPILLIVLVMLAVAVLFNAFFRWRRYPAWLANRGPARHGRCPRHPAKHRARRPHRRTEPDRFHHRRIRA